LLRPRRVADTLEPMDKSRKAFQLINSVLVERTVEEVLPIVRENRDGILQVKVNIEERLNKLVAEIREFSARYNGARCSVR
jgi:prefoldin subunit 2